MDLDGAVDLLRASVPGLVLAVLHGSRARGDARPDSDVDVALLADAPIDRWKLLELQADLAARLGAEVDVVDLLTADDVLRVQVVEHGRTLFERSATVRVERLGIPKESRGAFDLLEGAGVLSRPLAATLRAMVGFRDVAVHDYRRLDLRWSSRSSSATSTTCSSSPASRCGDSRRRSGVDHDSTTSLRMAVPGAATR
jgi:uncharacterized protein